MTVFGTLLREARMKVGLSQKALADRVGFNISHLNRIEKGERNPPKKDKILAIAGALDLNDSETDQLLLSAEYAPLRILSRISQDDRIVLGFGAPLSKEKLESLFSKKKEDRRKGSWADNKLIRLITQITKDDKLSDSRKSLIKNQVYSYLKWLYTQAKKDSACRNDRMS